MAKQSGRRKKEIRKDQHRAAAAPPRRNRAAIAAGLGASALIAIVAVILLSSSRSAENALKHKPLAELQTEAQSQPDNPKVLYYLGRSQLAAGQSHEALETLRRAAGLDPADEPTITACADAATAVEGPASAKAILEGFLKDHPNAASAHASLAKALLLIDDPMTAYREANEATRLDPKIGAAWQMVGDIEMKRENEAGAEAAYAKLVAMEPADWRHRLDHGNALADMGRFSEAISELREAMRLAPTELEPISALGGVLRTTAKTDSDQDAARQTLQQALAGGKAPPKVMFEVDLNMGKSYAAQDKWKDALGWYQQAVRLNPDNTELHYQLAHCYRMLGDMGSTDSEMQLHKEALRYHQEEIKLTSILKIDPGDDQTLLKLARHFASHHYNDRALTMYRILLMRAPQMQEARHEYELLARGA
jgi:tetratricopeptide (TPR) repeat protein